MGKHLGCNLGAFMDKRFDSVHSHLDNTCGCVGIGRRAALRSLCLKWRAGSTPVIRTLWSCGGIGRHGSFKSCCRKA